ncbi:hypothetical protein [uncultured Bacteroides sp.]|uniref:hypothetical protein n=1 Tax=uncultured Bacteroides sp. TaxID=162156 RepID=UPI002AAB14DF|nr:hypothetical protein [uncultured Bacteroides sp.]
MARLLFTTLFCLLISTASHGQNLNIKCITISRVITKIKNNVHEKSENEGPRANFKLEFENNTDSTITLDSSHSKFMLLFRYNGLDYKRKVLSLFLESFNEMKEVRIKPNEKYPVEFGIRLLSGTNLVKEKKNKSDYYNYSQEMLKVLPTLQIQYMDPDLRIMSGKIGSINVEDYTYIPQRPAKH